MSANASAAAAAAAAALAQQDAALRVQIAGLVLAALGRSAQISGQLELEGLAAVSEFNATAAQLTLAAACGADAGSVAITGVTLVR